jgi:hypothetical protein
VHNENSCFLYLRLWQGGIKKAAKAGSPARAAIPFVAIKNIIL